MEPEHDICTMCGRYAEGRQIWMAPDGWAGDWMSGELFNRQFFRQMLPHREFICKRCAGRGRLYGIIALIVIAIPLLCLIGIIIFL